MDDCLRRGHSLGAHFRTHPSHSIRVAPARLPVRNHGAIPLRYCLHLTKTLSRHAVKLRRTIKPTPPVACCAGACGFMFRCDCSCAAPDRLVLFPTTHPIDAGDNEDMVFWLKYYASDDERQRWQLDLPADPMPGATRRCLSSAIAICRNGRLLRTHGLASS